ncbi:MAG: sulfite exporter TauE/SafE family protein [Victivallis sp.]
MSQLLWIAGPLIGLVGMMSGGFWGVGCGWIVVPAMLILGFEPFDAVGISLLQMVPATIPTVVRQFPEIGWKKDQPGRLVVIPLAAGAIGASFFGKLLNEELFRFFGSPDVLQWMLAGFILLIGVQTACSTTRVYADESGRFRRRNGSACSEPGWRRGFCRRCSDSAAES